MNLEEKNRENLSFMIEDLANKLQVVNREAIKPENFELEDYEEIKDIYSMVKNKNNISVSEMQALIAELGRLRK